MANIASSKKDVRRSQRRAAANRSLRSAVKTRIIKVRRAVGEADVELLVDLAREAVAGLDRAASKGVLHANNTARRKSRLMKKLNSATAAARSGTAEPVAPAKGSRTRKAAPSGVDKGKKAPARKRS